MLTPLPSSSILLALRKLAASQASNCPTYLTGIASDVTRIIELIRTSRRKYPEDITLASINAYSTVSMPPAAVSVFRDMDQIFRCSPGIRSYNTLLNTFVDANRWDQVESFFAYFQTVSVLPSLGTYHILIKGFVKRGKFEKPRAIIRSDLDNALDLFEEMPQAGVDPDIICYNVMIDGIRKNEHVPDSFTYCTMIHGLCEMGNVEGTAELCYKMVEKGSMPDVVTCLFEKGQVEDALKKCEGLPETGLNPDANSYGILIHGLCENEYVAKALPILKEAEDKNAELDVFAYTSMINGLCDEGRLDDALRIFSQMELHDRIPTLQTYNSLINRFSQAGKIVDSFQLFDNMVGNGCAPNVVTYNTLINGLLKVERFTDASGLAKEMLKKGWKPD
ncbi:pentatricopeptide repeat-containing protein At3g09060-like [Aristolochia californica]|uniref:pentatricopeptide repeat-containing protein At3g09060-like n=1 Tax=Aristolochia californica TaxID=171875 RepID=UPI0035DE862D